MFKRKCIVIGFLAFCLTATLLIGITTSGNTTNPSTKSMAPYDPWCDINDDGVINIVDIVSLAIRFDTTGTPINKAALWKAGNISVPAAAFVSKNNSRDWRNDGNRLFNYEDSGWAYFVASVQLPHGANITKLTIYWCDWGGGDDVACFLFRYNQTWNQLMAFVTSTGSSGMGSSHDDSINYAIVNNNKYAYYLEVDIPPSVGHLDYQFLYAMIEYKY